MWYMISEVVASITDLKEISYILEYVFRNLNVVIQTNREFSKLEWMFWGGNERMLRSYKWKLYFNSVPFARKLKWWTNYFRSVTLSRTYLIKIFSRLRMFMLYTWWITNCRLRETYDSDTETFLIKLRASWPFISLTFYRKSIYYCIQGMQ